MKQARALRVPEVCVHIFAPIHTAAWICLSLVLAFVYLCSLMDGMQMPPGTTECNHSYCPGNSFSAPHFARQLHNGTPATPAQPPASVQEVDGPASSGAISSSLLSCSAFSSQVTVDPTRYGTGDDMPLAVAITQLSFIELLQRCGVSIAPTQPSRPPVPILVQDASVQTTPPCDVSQEVSTQTSDQQDMLPCNVAVQTSFHGAHTLSLDAAVQTTSPSTLPQHVSTQIGSRSASSFSVDMSGQTLVRSAVLHDAATQLPLTEFFIGCIYSNSPSDRQNSVRQSTPPMQVSPLLQPPPGLEQPAPPPELAAYSHLLTTHSASANSSPSLAQQSPVSTTQVGTHPVRTATSAKRSASTALAGTHNPIGSNPCTGTGPFPKPRALVLPMVNFGQPKSDKLGPTATVDSDLMHHQFRLSLLQWNPGPARRNPTNIASAACGKFHAVILQEASDHVPHIPDQFRVYTDDMDLAILLNKDTFGSDPMVFAFKKTPQAKVRGYGPTLRSKPTATPFTFWNTDSYILLCTHPQCRGQET